MSHLLQLLEEGNLAEKGRADEVVERIGGSRTRFDEIIPGLIDERPGLRMRAANVVDKVTRDHPHLLKPHKAFLLRHFGTMNDPGHMGIHAAMTVGRIAWTPEEADIIADYLMQWLDRSPNKFQRVGCLQGLADLAVRHPLRIPDTIAIIETAIQNGSASMQARGRKLLKLLTKLQKNL